MIRVGPSGSIAHYFLRNKLTLLFVVTSLLLGTFAVLMTPREEEPQIKVPMVDIFVPLPGASPEEVEQRVVTPLEKLLWEIPNVEYVYSTSSANMGMIIVRFEVNTAEETALLRIYDKVAGNLNQMPPGALFPLIKLKSIDDVPVLGLTLWGKGYDAYALTRVAQELEIELRAVPDVAAVEILGAQKRELRVVLDPVRMAAHGVNPLAVAQSLQAFNSRLPAGSLVKDNREVRLEVGSWIRDSRDAAAVLVGFHQGRPVYLGDVAALEDGPPLPGQYVLFGVGPGASARGIPPEARGQYPAVTLTVAKRPGVNATALNEVLLHKVESLQGRLIPRDVSVTVTRDYGESAGEKSDELIKHLLLATVSVVLLIAFMLGFRESLVVGIAVPVTLAFTLLIYYLGGYTLNRVTLFALIFSIGILVDDAIVVVENIYRHFTMKDGRSLTRKAIEAVDEVGNPTILATFTVIAAILPMAFVRGMMGPYMRPIPVGASAAMIISLVVAFMVSPWAAFKLLKDKVHAGEEHEGRIMGRLLGLYRRVMTRLTHDRRMGLLFLAGNVLLLALSVALVAFKVTKVKMLPFDNKSEFQVVLDLPEGASLEKSLQAAQAMAQKLMEMPEVTDYQIYAGTSGPITFNGLVRHYYLRQIPHAADIQVNLLPKHARGRQSHDLAKEARSLLEPLAKELGVALKVVEIPPGPPVLSTLVAEIYGPDLGGQFQAGRDVLRVFRETAGVVDTDIYAVDPQEQVDLVVDPRKASAAGLSVAEVSLAVSMAVRGATVTMAHMPRERETVPITVRMPRESRFDLAALASLQIQNRQGTLIPLSQVVDVQRSEIPQEIYHKNLRRVVYVVGDVAGVEESPVYAMFKLNRALDRLRLPDGTTGLKRFYTEVPLLSDRYAVKWDGEWQITYEVFRDLGIAFALVLVFMYILVVGWFRSYLTPLAIMAPIPLSLVGILPAHAAAGVFFTATSMIGFIALAGIVVRNSILVIDFAEMKMRQGMPLKDAVVEGGAVRFRPMLLTALAVVVGSSVMLADPIFQGMAVALMAGEVASTLLSWGAIPILYVLFYGDKPPVEDEALEEEE